MGIPVITFIGNVLLARKLTPEDYGLITMLAIVMGIAWNFTESGFSDCLIRKNNADKRDFGTVSTFNIVSGAMMYLLIYFMAPIVAKYFQRLELINISRIIGLSILIRAITVTEFTRLRKELKVKTITIIELGSNIAAITAAYIMACNEYGYWSLVFQTLVLAIMNIVLIIILTKWTPYLCFSWVKFKNMSHYSLNLLISNFFNQIGQNLFSVFIGKFQMATSLGFFRQAQKIKDAPIQALNSIILSTNYPLLASETDNIKRIELHKSLFNKFLFFQFLIVFILIGSAHPLIDILFGKKWIVSVPYFQLMLIVSLFYPVTTFNLNIAKIYGRSKLFRNLSLFRNAVILIALLSTMRSSIKEILYFQILATYISICADTILCGRIIDFGFKNQFKIVLSQLWIPVVTLLISYSSVISIKNSYLNITIFLILFFLLYVLINEITNQITYINFKKDFFLYLKK